MALSRFSMLVVIATTFLPSIAMAREFVVGDDHGWTSGFDYNTWASNKVFQVGDTLVFKYAVGAHNVFKVNGTAFQSCTIPPNSTAMTSGNDNIVLATPGREWYICGVAGHCSAGQKLVITVQPNMPPTPSPSPSAATPGLSVSIASAPEPLVPAPTPVQHVPHFGRWMPNKKLLKGFQY